MAGKETVKGTFGNEPIELNNAATEATLTAMLKLAQKDSMILAEMAKKAGVNEKIMKESLDKVHQGSGGGGVGGALAGGALGVVGGAAKVAGGLLSDMAGMALSAVSSLGNFVGALANGTTKASELATAFQNLPLGIGTFAQILGFANKLFEDNMQTYRAMSNSGSGLVGTLSNLKMTATGLGLSLEQYSNLFGKNADVMVRLGGSMVAGSKNLVAMNQSFIASDMGQKVLKLGFSFEELNNLIPNYVRSTGDAIDTSKNIEKEFLRLQTTSAKYAEDLDYVARMTGENRQELEQKKQEMMKEAAYQLFYLKQGPEQKKIIDEIMNRNLTIGQGMADAAKASLQGFAGAFTPEGKAVNSQFAGLNRIIAEQKKLLTSNLTPEERRLELNKLQVRSIQEVTRVVDQMGPTVLSMGNQNKLAANGMKELITQNNKWRTGVNGTLQSGDAMLAKMGEISTTQADDSEKASRQLEIEAKTRELSVEVQGALLPLMKDLQKVTLDLITKFSKIIKENMPEIENALNQVVRFIDKVFNNPDAAIAQVKGYLQELLAWIFESMTSSPFGKYVFGDAAASMKQRSQLNAALAIDAARYAELKKQDAAGKLQGRDKEEFDRDNQIYRMAAGVVAFQMKNKEYDKDSAIEEANRRLKAEGKDPNTSAGFNKNGMLETNYQRELRLIYEKFQADKAQRDIDAAKIQGGQYQYEQIPALIKKLDQNLYNPNLAPARAGGSPGGLPENWGRESLVKLHGKEAVLTEAQLAAMNNKSGGNTTIELADLKIVAEGINTLNRQAAMQNKILNQMIDNQMTMIRRTNGNRLMA